MKSRRNYTKEFKLSVIQELESGEDVVKICKRHGLYPQLVLRWRREYRADPINAFGGHGNPSTAETKIAELERKIGQMYLEIDFLKKVLKKS